MLDAGNRSGNRLSQRTAEHPAVAERVDDGRVARPVVLVDLALDGRVLFACLLQGRVGVGDAQHQADRDRARRRSLQSEFWMFVGQIQHAISDSDFRMPNSPIAHHDWITDHDRIEGINIPGDRRTCVRHAQVGQRCRARDRVGGGWLGQDGKGLSGAAHDNSFTSRRQGQCGLQALA
jgi:hypothetical protein